MNSRVRQAMLRILLLTEEFSPEELAEATSLLDDRGKDVFAFLRQKNSASKRAAPRPASNARMNKKGETRALQELKLTDGEKYQVLREFESSIREGKVLKTLDDFREFSTILGKDFGAAKSVKDALPHLTAVLARMDLDNMRAAIEKAPTRQGDDENAFRRLANHIISGARSVKSLSRSQITDGGQAICARVVVSVFGRRKFRLPIGSLRPGPIRATAEVSRPSGPWRQMCRFGDAAVRLVVARTPGNRPQNSQWNEQLPDSGFWE